MHNTSSQSQSQDSQSGPRVIIVGAGISGICLAIQLKRHGIDDFVILEKSGDIGGTWLDNTYPGCGCDVPSMLYSYSFEINENWSRKYAPQSEILDYFRTCVDKYSLREHIQFNTSVTRAEWNDETKRWHIALKSGQAMNCGVFVSAVGQLSRPQTPAIDGIESFNGSLFHSARWDHSFDTRGKRIGVVGNGASAIQIVPELASNATHVTIFQRSPNWILPRHDHRYPWLWRQMNRFVPFFARLQRLLMYLLFESRILCYNRRTFLNRGFTAWSRRQMRRASPAHLHADLIPSFPAGCKRVLLSNNYLQCLNRDNVDLHSDKIISIDPAGINTSSSHIPLDAIVMATGFETHRFFHPIEIVGCNGKPLDQVWPRRPKTFLGLLTPDFPNFFMLYGPNTNLGHNSVIFMVECQVRYILQLLKTTSTLKADSFEVTEEATERFDQMLQRELKKKVWNGYAASWYKNSSGDITNNWCRSTLAYLWQTRRVDKSKFRFSNRPCTAAAASTPIAR